MRIQNFWLCFSQKLIETQTLNRLRLNHLPKEVFFITQPTWNVTQRFLYCLGGNHLKYLCPVTILLTIWSLRNLSCDPKRAYLFSQNINKAIVLRIKWSNRSEIWTKLVSSWIFYRDKFTSRFIFRFGTKFWD